MLIVVKRSLFLLVPLAVVNLASPARAEPPASRLPPLPGSEAPPPAVVTPATADAQAPGALAGISPQQLYERIRRGVVALERNGIPLAIGTVLGGDGRVLTSLSGLNGADTAD